MKRITLIILLLSAFSFGQFFEEHQNNDNKATHKEDQFFKESQGYEPQPDYGTDGPGQPGDDVPLDDWAFLLPLAGIAVGVYFIRKKKLLTQS